MSTSIIVPVNQILICRNAEAVSNVRSHGIRKLPELSRRLSSYVTSVETPFKIPDSPLSKAELQYRTTDRKAPARDKQAGAFVCYEW